MRIVRFTHHDEPRVGILRDEHSAALAPRGTSVAAALSGNAFRHTEEVLELTADTSWLPPVDPGALVVNIGANYRDHALPSTSEEPNLTWFIKGPQSWAAHRDAIRIPPGFPDRVDYEGELCVVFGTPCHRVSASDALSYVGGYTLMNDVSARDAWPDLKAAITPAQERVAWNRMLLGKQLPTFGPMGPVTVSADEIADPQQLTLTTTLNGRIVQQAQVANMKIGIADLISRLSQYFAFRPGDVLTTGTPGGTAQERGRYLRAGDEVSVSVESVGTLTNMLLGA